MMTPEEQLEWARAEAARVQGEIDRLRQTVDRHLQEAEELQRQNDLCRQAEAEEIVRRLSKRWWQFW